MKHAESLAEHIRYLEEEIARTESRLKVANQCADHAQRELDNALIVDTTDESDLHLIHGDFSPRGFYGDGY